MAQNTAPATTDATEPAPAKNRQISTTLTPAQYTALTDIRFDRRHDKQGDALNEALTDYLAKYAK